MAYRPCLSAHTQSSKSSNSRPLASAARFRFGLALPNHRYILIYIGPVLISASMDPRSSRRLQVGRRARSNEILRAPWTGLGLGVGVGLGLWLRLGFGLLGPGLGVGCWTRQRGGTRY